VWIGSLAGKIGLAGLAREEKKKNPKFFVPFPNNFEIEINLKKYFGVSEKYEIFSRDRLGYLEKLWLLTL
jgi:hypothetical protein